MSGLKISTIGFAVQNTEYSYIPFPDEYLLTEDGDKLLTEDDDQIILE